MKKLMILLLVITSCSLGGAQIRPLNPPFFPQPPANAPQEFKEGFLDGCETGFAAHGSDVYRTTYGFKQNPSLALNPVYYQAWKDSENYCRTYIFEYAHLSTRVWCTLDGLTNDCGDTSYNGVPFMGNSTDNLGYNFIGGSNGIPSMLGGGGDGEAFVGNTTDMDSFFGNW